MAKGKSKMPAKKATQAKSNAKRDDGDMEELKTLIEKEQEKLNLLKSSIKNLKEEAASTSESETSKYFKNSSKADNKSKQQKAAKGRKRKSDENEKTNSREPGGKRQKISTKVTSKESQKETELKVTRKSRKGDNDSTDNKPDTSKRSAVKRKNPKNLQEEPSSLKKNKAKEKQVVKKNKAKEKQVITPKPIELRPGATLEEEVTALLNMHENIPMSQVPHEEMMSDDDDDSEDEGDWEEVEDAEVSPHKSPAKSQVPKETVQITLQGPQFNQKKKKKKFDMEEWFRLKVNRLKKETQAEAHKVHLLCLIVQCQQRRQLCSSPLLQCAAFSHVPTVYHCKRPSATWTLGSLTTCMRWFQGVFSIEAGMYEEDWISESLLLKRLATRRVGSVTELVLLFVIILQAIGLDTRLVTSFQPLTFKPSDLIAKGKSLRPRQPAVVDLTNSEKTEKTGSTKQQKEPTQSQSKRSKAQPKNTKARKRASKVEKDDSESKYFKQRKKKEDVCEISSEGSDFEDELTKFRTPKGSAKKQQGKKKKILSSESDDSVKITKSLLKEKGTDVWVEVFLESENKWVCVDCVRGKVDHPEVMEEAATRPISYILAVDNDIKVKDITQKYAGNWVTQTRKLRIDEEWWKETLEPYCPVDLIRDRTEDYLIETQMQKKPLPTSMAEYKNNPLYALKRHLLKFEAIYPPDCAPMGFVKGEPVYPRSAVKELHTKDTWLKEARDIRRGEEPYKMVKARPKKGRGREQPAEPMLPVYGEWQTEPYMPPLAVDGKVPRSDYGNVQLFKDCMLPGGTVHLKLPGLNRVAKKLKIDCAPAMVGWDFHSGFNHAVMDGYVVCEEYKDVLIAAWDEEQEIIEEREREKREKRVFGNWKLLIRGLLLKEQMKVKFNLTDEDSTASTSHSGAPSKANKKSKKKGKDEQAQDTDQAWPLNRQAEKKDVHKEVATIQKSRNQPESNTGHLFPFEVI